VVDEMADGAIETLQEFIETLQNAAASSGLVTSLVHNLTQAVSRVWIIIHMSVIHTHL